MALVFPTSPTNGQVYTDSTTGNRYVYDSSKGVWKYSSNNVGVSVGTAPPPINQVAPGAMWYNTNTGRTFILYDDGDSKQWVENIPAPGSFDSATVAGYANAASILAVAPAFNKANSALANTTGTFAGSLTTTGDVTSGGTLQALSTVQSSSGADLSLNANGANRDVILKVNATELARLVGSTGKLGIGTTSPAHKLHVANGNMAVTSSTGAGQISITDDSDSDRGLLLKSNHSGTSNTYVGTNSSIKNLIFGIDQIERMRIDISGRVTTPYQPRVQAYKTVGGWDSINGYYIFNTAAVNVGSHYNTSTGLFTCPVAGYYKVTAAILIGYAAGAQYFSLYKNGSAYSSGGGVYLNAYSTSVHATLGHTWIVSCAVNDSLGIYAVSSGTGIYGPGWNNLTIELVG